jgi:hypothetical protein
MSKNVPALNERLILHNRIFSYGKKKKEFKEQGLRLELTKINSPSPIFTLKVHETTLTQILTSFSFGH